ncbi:hypothetical protein [Pseudomonas fluorescens]|uniref:Short-chain dehydrogenase n=2 Tax=Pseudomonas fluorescens TaxID=294 RepID=A0ABY1TMS0_PSEFL|nr:hypothetical protein [Pseudomonas fluorescens]MCI4607348.1 hypothetical protein [Pseudomonas fluorescens]PQA98683.1 hypothetical protein B0A76_21950 [Pseudomonas fluorescens]RFP92841.1 hypothetical protein D0N73_29680 [Pseudomonas fluorescens]TWR50531.1 hypothetical protein FIP59_04745 [Pseudomonas fluorescens]UKJ66804.1 hypothetical protein H1Q68_17865 [Pseudomonas fluorescens]
MSYIPLQISASEHPVLFINSQASLCDLHAVAGERMRAAKDAIESLACMDLKTIDIEDLTHFFQTASLLAQDGYAIWKVLEARAMEIEYPR